MSTGQREQQFREHVTCGEVYGPAMWMTDERRAREYFERIVSHHMAVGGVTRSEAERIERYNLREYASYYDNETFTRVKRLFRCDE
jgi:hypothetical protein